MEESSRHMDRRSKEIFERQNMPGLVAAQKTAHNCYSVGKIWSVFLVVTSVAVPVAINVVLSLFDIDILNGCLIFASFLCLIVSEFIRTRIKKWKFYGAGMQQYFDEFVFGLKNSCKKYIYPQKLSLYERLKLMKRFDKRNDESFRDWYSDFSALPYEEAVYQCQKQNIRWEMSAKKTYLVVLIIMSAVIIIGIVINAILQRMNVWVMVAVLLTLVPVATFLYNAIKKLCEDVKSRNSLYLHIESMEEKHSPEELWDEIEELQVEIFDYRKQAYLVPDWFHKLFRHGKQKEEDNYAENLSKERR